jgi:CheY-like chemotaxis protein
MRQGAQFRAASGLRIPRPLMQVTAIRRVAITVPGWPAMERQCAVLLVSGDGEFRAVAVRVLRRAGYAAETAPHGGHALLACMHQHFDIILVDTRSVDGSARLVAGLARHSPGTRVVAVTERPASAEQLLARLVPAPTAP